MTVRPVSPLEECVPKRKPPEDPSRVTVTSLAQAGREAFTDKLQFDVDSTDKQARLPRGWLQNTSSSTMMQLFARASRSALLSHRSPGTRFRGRRDACVTTRHTNICLRHRITCLSRYFAQSVSMGPYGVRYSLIIIYSCYKWVGPAERANPLTMKNYQYS